MGRPPPARRGQRTIVEICPAARSSPASPHRELEEQVLAANIDVIFSWTGTRAEPAAARALSASVESGPARDMLTKTTSRRRRGRRASGGDPSGAIHVLARVTREGPTSCLRTLGAPNRRLHGSSGRKSTLTSTGGLRSAARPRSVVDDAAGTPLCAGAAGAPRRRDRDRTPGCGAPAMGSDEGRKWFTDITR